jgi:hypothetical protein
MSSRASTVELVLHPALRRCVEASGEERIEVRIEASLIDLLGGLGLGALPTVALATGADDRAARVLVNGGEQPFPPSFLTRLWFTAAPEELRHLAFDPTHVGAGEGHTWLIEAATELAVSADLRGTLAIRDLVEQLAIEAVSLHPGRLVDADLATDYFEHAGAPLTDETAAAVMCFLLELGVSLEDGERVTGLVRAALTLGRSPEEVCEEVFAVLRAPGIEIHLDGRSFAAFCGDSVEDSRIGLDDQRLDETLVEAMGLVRELRLTALAADVPVVFVNTRSSGAYEMRIKVNDRLGPLVPLPGPDELAVPAPPAALAGIERRGLVDPLTGSHQTAIPATDRDAVEAHGLSPVVPQAYMVGAFGRSVTALAYRLMAVDRLELMLARVEYDYPVVVHGALARYSLTELTHLFRALVREQVAVDDVWRILNAVVMFDQVERPESDCADRMSAVIAAVRNELADRIATDCWGPDAIEQGVAFAVETELSFEERIESWPEDGVPDKELRAARRAAWEAVGAAAVDGPFVILTSRSARPRLRRALDHEMPDVSVLARPEIPPGLSPVRAAVMTG